jgi:hypothetical protein
VGEELGLAGVLPDGRFGARLDADGNLFVDTSHTELLSEALLGALAPPVLERIEVGLRRACRTVLAATHSSGARAASLDDSGARAAVAELGRAVESLLPYPIMAKFVPEVLLRALTAEGDPGFPPFDRPSPGARLSAALLRLDGTCRAGGYSPERLAAEWPAIPGELEAAVRTFCRRYAGFGPVPWEGPGYETPEHVFAAMRAAFGGSDPGRLRAGLGRALRGSPSPPPPPTELAGMIRRGLVAWFEFLDLEIWYVRGAFYRGMLPLLRRIAAVRGDGGEGGQDLLFHRVEEFEGQDPSPEVLEGRRRAYLSNPAYLERIGAGPPRLARIMEGP